MVSVNIVLTNQPFYQDASLETDSSFDLPLLIVGEIE